MWPQPMTREPRGSVSSKASETLKPARRRLQKLAPKIRGLRLGRASVDVDQHVEALPASPVTPPTPLTPTSPTSAPNRTSLIPVPPDLSDSKWLEYLEKTGLMATPGTSPHTRDSLRASHVSDQRRSRVLPEFAHLAMSPAQSRPSLDGSSLSSPAMSCSTSSTWRRQAKTPVFRIGQLETKAAHGRHPTAKHEAVSVDLLAAQYRALLESRGGEDPILISPLSQSDPTLSQARQPDFARSEVDRRESDGPENILLEPAVVRLSQRAGHMSATGDEDCMYFKPVAFSAEPSLRSDEGFRSQSPSTQSSAGGSLGMQICLDLLTKELSSAFAQRSRNARGDAMSLQIWTMIEAYERMQEQVDGLQISPREKHAMKLMLDNWVSALYSVHGSLARADSESEYSSVDDV